MANDNQVKVIPSVPRLERFSLSFEYDKTIRQIKHDIRVRTLVNNK